MHNPASGLSNTHATTAPSRAVTAIAVLVPLFMMHMVGGRGPAEPAAGHKVLQQVVSSVVVVVVPVDDDVAKAATGPGVGHLMMSQYLPLSCCGHLELGVVVVGVVGRNGGAGRRRSYSLGSIVHVRRAQADALLADAAEDPVVKLHAPCICMKMSDTYDAGSQVAVAVQSYTHVHTLMELAAVGLASTAAASVSRRRYSCMTHSVLLPFGERPW